MDMLVDKSSVDDNKKSSSRLTVCQMFLLNCVVCGIEICACCGFTYIPPLILKSGFSEENMSMVLGMGPLLALLFSPVIGQASDRCQSSFGRRRPFILGLSLLLLVSLYLIPFGENLVSYIIGKSALSKTLGVILLTLGSILLDFTSQVCLSPCEALLNDASKDTGQQDKIFSIYSLMVSVGGITGYLLSAINWKTTVVGEFFGGEEASVFSILMVIFVFLLTATLLVAAEKPLTRNLSSYKNNSGSLEFIPKPKIPMTLESGYESNSSSRSVSEENLHDILIPKENISVAYATQSSSFHLTNRLKTCISSTFSKNSVMSHICNFKQNVCSLNLNFLPNSILQMFNVPIVLRQLALANFCSWTAVMSFNLYFTDFVGQTVYHGNPYAEPDSEAGNLYDEGIRMGSWGLLLHCLTSAVYSLFVERLIERCGCKMAYMLGMISFIFAMAGMVLVPNILVVNTMAALTGFAFATLTTIPFILLSKYFDEKEIYFFDAGNNIALSGAGMGAYMAKLDSAYYLSEVVLSACLGYFVRFTGTVTTYMVTAGIMGLFSIFFINRIVISKQDVLKLCSNQRNDLGV